MATRAVAVTRIVSGGALGAAALVIRADEYVRRHLGLLEDALPPPWTF
jgi:hypothetical protein